MTTRSFDELCRLDPDQVHLVPDGFGGYGLCVYTLKEDAVWLADAQGIPRNFDTADAAIFEAQLIATRGGLRFSLKLSLLPQKTEDSQ